MNLYRNFKKLDIDFGRIGLAPNPKNSDYFCTPEPGQHFPAITAKTANRNAIRCFSYSTDFSASAILIFSSLK